MPLAIGYLLPTRERIIDAEPGTAALLRLAERAEALGFDSLWAGDSLLARPRHDPLTLLAAVAARTTRPLLGTAVLLPVLRNPVVLAQQIATIDQLSEGRLVLGVGIGADTPQIRAEFAAAGVPFEKRLGRTLEGLRLARALWRGEPVQWDGRWPLAGQVLAPTPARSGGPPIWMGTSVLPGLQRTGREFDGWFPLGPDAPTYAERWAEVTRAAQVASRRTADVTPAMYLTVCVDDSAQQAERRLDDYLGRYYAPAPAALMRRVQACYAGTADDLWPWLRSFVDAGARHLVLRFVGDHERLQSLVADGRTHHLGDL